MNVDSVVFQTFELTTNSANLPRHDAVARVY